MKIGFNARLRKFAAALEQIKTEKIFLEAARETQDLALDLNRGQLLGESVNSEGKKLGTYSKKSKKQGPIDLYLTGEFQGRMFLNTKQLPIFIGSKDEKTPILTKIYGPVLGLTKENEEEYSAEVRKIFTDKVNSHIENLKTKILL